MTRQSNPFGFHTLTPYFVVANARAFVEFLQKVFNAALRHDINADPNGKVEHAELTIGDSTIMLSEPKDGVRPTSAALYVYVEDCDATIKKAISLGALLMAEPIDFPHGDRHGAIKDPFGNVWWIATHKWR